MTSRLPTLRSRFRRSLVGLTLAILAVCGLMVFLGARHALRADLDSSLFSIARVEVASSTDGPPGTVHVHADPGHPRVGGPESPYEKLARIEDASGNVLAQTPNLSVGPALASNPALRSRALRGQIVYGDGARGGQRMRVVYLPFADSFGRPRVEIVALSTRQVDQAQFWLAGLLVVSAAIGVGLAIPAADRLSARLTRPLEQVGETAQAIGGGVGERIPAFTEDRELVTVTEALNGMLDRLQTLFEQRESVLNAQQRFVADAAHELRTPITNLLGTMEVALRRPRSSAEYRETLALCMDEAGRLSRLCDDLLTLARLESGTLPVALEPCELRTIAEESSRLIRSSAAGREIRLALTGPPAWAMGAPDRVRQIVDNLLSNAVRYSPTGATVHICTASDSSGCSLSVADEGPGFSSTEGERVFDRFYRVDASRSRGEGGAGLGLPIARGIARALGGDLVARSRAAAGAEFVLTLPALGKEAGGAQCDAITETNLAAAAP